MNTSERRDVNKRKWLSIAKKYYHSCDYHKMYKSITEFLNKDGFAKLLRNTKTPIKKLMSDKIWIKQENRRERYNSKKIINETIQSE